jgi:DNA topoisomerase VI subunit A
MAAKKQEPPAMAAKKSRERAKTDRDADTLGEDREAREERAGEATRGNNPALEIRTRALSNVSFNEKKKIIELGDKTQSREFFNTAMARKFMQTMLVASGARRSSTRARPSASVRCST